MFNRILTVGFCLLLLAGASRALASDTKINLIFSIEQSFPNSPVQNMDLQSLERTFSDVSSLRKHWNVYALFGCSQRDKDKLYHALSISKRLDVPFFLDVWTTDTKFQPNAINDAASSPYSKQYGECMDIASLRILKMAFGVHFAGIRLHEVSASNLSVQMYRNGEDWFPRKSWMYPKDGYYSRSRLEKYFLFAYQEKMMLSFSDPYWIAGGNYYLRKPFVKQTQIEDDLYYFSKKYPGVLVPFYANNEPLKQGSDPLMNRISDWSKVIPSRIVDSKLGFGLSDQAWLCDRVRVAEDKCDPKYLASWSESAIYSGAKWIQFEPYWYFFKYPRPGKAYSSFTDVSGTGGFTENATVIIRRMESALGRNLNR